MIVKISRHLRGLARTSKAIRKEFYPLKKEKIFSRRAFIDPLLEDKFTPIKGVCHKYRHRILVELTLNCASFCRFCTRRRKVGDIKKGKLNQKDVDAMLIYIKSKPEINEIIFSGGDPLMAQDLLIYALKKFTLLAQIKVIRLHTRVPVSDPKLLTKSVLNALTKIKNQALYISLHFEHPDELTSETIRAIKKLRKTGTILLSQSVFLKGINDSYEILSALFTQLMELGVRPYYIYHCDLVKGIEHFIVSIAKEVKIMTRLRSNLSGLALPTHVIDTPNGYGKIPVPLDFWQFNKNHFKDFTGQKIKMY